MTTIKTFERPYVVESAEYSVEAVWDHKVVSRSITGWSFLKAFEFQHDAEAFASRMAEDYEVVRIRRKESEDDYLA